MSQDLISVVIRCRNEARWIGHSIQSVIDHLPGKNEIILVDNNSTDQSLEICQQFQANHSLEENKYKYTTIKVVNIDKYSPGAALNLGVSHSSGEYVMFLSAHCSIETFDLDKTLRDLETYCAVFGNQDPIYRGQKITKRYIWSHFVNNEVVNMYSPLEGRYFFHNALSIMKKSTIVDSPFDEDLWGKEDRYWAVDMIEKKGNSILYDPKISCRHYYTSGGNTWKGVG